MRRLQSGPAFKELAVNEYDVLFTLSRCPSGWLRLNELNDNVLLSQSSLSRLVDRLEKRGLVERMPAPNDGRGRAAEADGRGRGPAKADRPRARPGHRRPGRSGADSGRTEGAAEADGKAARRSVVAGERATPGRAASAMATSFAGSSTGRSPLTTAVTRSS